MRTGKLKDSGTTHDLTKGKLIQLTKGDLVEIIEELPQRYRAKILKGENKGFVLSCFKDRIEFD